MRIIYVNMEQKMFDFVKKLFGVPTMQDKIDHLEKIVAEKEAQVKAAAKEEIKEIANEAVAITEKVAEKAKKNVRKAAKKVAE